METTVQCALGGQQLFAERGVFFFFTIDKGIDKGKDKGKDEDKIKDTDALFGEAVYWEGQSYLLKEVFSYAALYQPVLS